MSTLHTRNADAFDVEAARRHFDFPRNGRIITNNAASTQPPRELLQLHHALAPQYENVHRGQSRGSMACWSAARRCSKPRHRFCTAAT